MVIFNSWKYNLINSKQIYKFFIISNFPFRKWKHCYIMFERFSSSAQLKGMTILDKNAFTKTVSVPCLQVDVSKLNKIKNIIKPFILKMPNFSPIKENLENKSCKTIIFNPLLIKDWADFNSSNIEVLDKLEIKKSDLAWKDLEIGYDNWTCNDIFKATLPDDGDGDGFSGFSQIGHIVHVNVRDHLLPYKSIIGQVLIDKIPRISLVVNKAKNIDNVYRTFEMEILAGNGDTVTTTKESGCKFTLDFAKVYWNPKLATEHERILKKLKSNDYVFDVFAGIGPFAIPAGKKKCIVHANDLNPHSFKWLQKNIEDNKVSQQVVAYNLDGKQFIQESVKQKLIEIWNKFSSINDELPNIHIIMNLPASAVEFLKYFSGLCAEYPYDSASTVILPVVHCYCFAKNVENYEDAALKYVEDALKVKLKSTTVEVFKVRNVAPYKEMMRVSFHLPSDVLFNHFASTPKRVSDELLPENLSKKQCICNDEISC